MNPLSEGVVFVGGCMRSGTSLLHQVLCQSEDANPFIQACFYLTHQLKSYHYFLDKGQLFAPDYFGDEKNLTEFTRDTVRRFLDQTRRRWDQPRVLVLKQTELTYYFSLLARLIPEALFVISVRDPRDTVASMIEVGQKQRHQHLSSPYAETGRDISRLCSIYNGIYQYLLRAVDENIEGMRDRTMFVRYEDVVRDTAATLRQLSTFTSLPLEAFKATGQWRPNTVTKAVNANQFWRSYLTDLSGGAISDRSVSKHQRVLTDLERLQVDLQCTAMKHRFGYDASAAAET